MAKLAQPRLPPIFRRKRLLELLDLQFRHASVIWIEGAPGSGKTTLAASWCAARKRPTLWYQVDAGDRDPASFFYYLGEAVSRSAPRFRTRLPALTPEYLYGVEAFTRNFFRELARRLKPRDVLVIDNLHEVNPDAPLFDILRNGLAELRSHCVVLLLSRAAPPERFARARLDGWMAVLSNEQLLLTESESAGLVGFLGRDAAVGNDSVRLKTLHDACGGWFAGMLLLTEAPSSVRGWRSSATASGQHRLFGYFAGEVFSQRAASSREFLLATALLPSFTGAMAERLTGNRDAPKLIKELMREHQFTIEHTDTEGAVSYRYHHLYREFLLEHASAQQDGDWLARHRQMAAQILETDNQVEEALSLYALAGDMDAAAALLIKKSPQLIASGRLKTLAHTITRLPEALRAEYPWLEYWLGISVMPSDLAQSRRHLKIAYAAMRVRQDLKGMVLSWSAIIDGIMHEQGDFAQFDSMMPMIADFGGRELQRVSPELAAYVAPRVFCALATRGISNPDFDYWLKCSFDVLHGSSKDFDTRLMAGFCLFCHHAWVGDNPRMHSIAAALAGLSQTQGASPLAHLTAELAQAWHDWMSANHAAASARMERTLAYAETTGVRIWDPLLIETATSSALTGNQIDAAEALLDRLAPYIDRTRTMDRHYYYHQRGWIHLLRGDIAAARAAQEQALTLAVATGIDFTQAEAHFGMAIVLHESGDRASAQHHLAAARAHGAALGSEILAFTCGLAAAQFAFDRGEPELGLPELRAALQRGRLQGYVMTTYWRPQAMSRLLSLALKHGIELEYAHRLIRTRDLLPSEPEEDADYWPHPIRIYALGQFSIQIGGKSLNLGAKAPKKPLGILKALIAFGGRGVAIIKIMSALWPQQGMAARAAFDVALMRLRQLLPEPSALIVSDGLLSLNDKVCWLDVWSFERAVSSCADSRGNTARPEDLYRGRFLDREGEEGWIANARDQLAAKYRRLMLQSAQAEEQAGNWDGAAQIYRRALERDNLCEEFHFRLMQCEMRLGRRSEAIRIYRRCRELLSLNLQSKPSAALEGLYQRALDASNATTTD